MTSYTLKISVPAPRLYVESPRLLVLRRGIMPPFFLTPAGNPRPMIELLREYPELFDTVISGETKTITVSVNNQTFRKAFDAGLFHPANIPNANAPTLAQHHEYLMTNMNWHHGHSNGNVRVHGANAWPLYPHIFLDTTTSTNASLLGSSQQSAQNVDIHVCDVQLVNVTFATIDL